MQPPAVPADRARLLISCPDQRGIVAAVSKLLYELGANMVDADQHITGPELGMFFMRLEFDLPQLRERLHELQRAFAPLGRTYQMDWRIVAAGRPHRLAIFVSRQDHCLLELLWQWKAGDIRTDLSLVVSNHADLRDAVAAYGVPFHHIPVTRETKAQAEEQALRLLLQHEVDLVVLARYMQILSADFVHAYPNRIINIHHSFLPAFVGANPYARAYERGVKLIGATAHYVTADLDAGPIIEQDVHRVGHRDDLEDLVRIGRHVERVVLGRAVRWHLEDRVLVHGNKTVVFA